MSPPSSSPSKEASSSAAPPAAPGGETARDRLEAAGKLTDRVVAARVDGTLWDLVTPLPDNVERVDPIPADHPDALAVIRHSSAHVMADAVQRLFPGTKVAFGPAVDDGFYYDVDPPAGTKLTEEDLRRIEAEMKRIISEDHRFRREVLPYHEAKALLERMGETFKLEHLDRLHEKGEEISVYRHGDWVDLCEGPHVPSTKFLQAFQLTSLAGAYWRGDERNPMLQRIYGTAFANAKALKAHLKRLEEAKKRDHRKLVKELDLVAFHPIAPASPFFLPRGARVYNALIEYVRDLYDRHGYEEVITPQVFDNELFLTSGHLPGYAENMFLCATPDDLEAASDKLVAKAAEASGLGTPEDVRKDVQGSLRYGVKPMNCPGHCMMFGFRKRSYRELPWRVADFGRLHRYERSGVVQGLTRVRTFAQDDGHVFCAYDQLPDEIGRFIDLVYEVYEDFGFEDVQVFLATRPEKRIGADATWDQAEAALEAGIRAKGIDFELAEGEGAFYGPKVEFHLKDAIGRPWQLGTIQADFNLPERFDLTYVGEDNQAHRPAVLHRAIFGSVERFFGVLVEHVAGAFPTWLAPEQIRLVTVSERFNDYAEEVAGSLRDAGIRVDADLSADKLGAKIRTGRLLRIPYLGIIGQKEVDDGGVSLRSRDENGDLGFFPLAAAIARLEAEQLPPSRRPTS